ncbi:hypothetical protein RZS08_52150, partial [Arthrospira platensis SPKY1]|nr:hypothetical protein [Arthrospira platensis SPKY1]
MEITASLDNRYRDGVFGLKGEVVRLNNAGSVPVTVELLLQDAAGKAILRQDQTLNTNTQTTKFQFTEIKVKGIQSWSAETPHLYDLFITLRAKDQ